MIFNNTAHTYTNDKGELYTSATAFIKRYAKPFERDKIAAKYAKKHKKTVQQVLDEWSKLGDDAIKKGIHFHKLKETELLNSDKITIDGEEYDVYNEPFDDEIKICNVTKLEPLIYPELMIWSDKYKIAGQADYVEVTRGGRLNIKDYKTSKEIKLRSFEKWDGTHEMMYFPINHLEDCNFNHYSLQLNLYAFLIKQHNRNLKIGKLTIEHIVGDYNEDTGFVLNNIIPYNVPDLQKEIRNLLEYHKYQKQ